MTLFSANFATKTFAIEKKVHFCVKKLSRLKKGEGKKHNFLFIFSTINMLKYSVNYNFSLSISSSHSESPLLSLSFAGPLKAINSSAVTSQRARGVILSDWSSSFNIGAISPKGSIDGNFSSQV